MVSIHRPLGYGPSTLPLRHAAVVEEKVSCPMLMRKKRKKDCFFFGILSIKLISFQNDRFPLQRVSIFSYLTIQSSVAQWKRAGPITQRSMDRNHPLLAFFFWFFVFVLLFFFLSFFPPPLFVSFFFKPIEKIHKVIIVPLIAQLVERRTVVV